MALGFGFSGDGLSTRSFLGVSIVASLAGKL